MSSQESSSLSDLIALLGGVGARHAVTSASKDAERHSEDFASFFKTFAAGSKVARAVAMSSFIFVFNLK